MVKAINKRNKKPMARKAAKPAFDVNELIKHEELQMDDNVRELLEAGQGMDIQGRIGSRKKSKKSRETKPEPESEEEESDLNSEEEKELEIYLAMKAEEEDTEDKSNDESEDEDEEDNQEEHVIVYANQTQALLARLDDLKVTGLDWMEQMAISHVGVTADQIPDVNDDLKRELAFYEQALEAANIAREKILKSGTPFSRPPDYFAEMVKTDLHMEKIRQKLLDEERGIMESEKAKKQRDLKKFGKKVQVEKLVERQKTKKDALEKVKGMRRKGIAPDEDFDVDAVNEGATDGTRSTDGPNKRRDNKNTKYGFGGAKRNAKSNTRDSTDDISAFSVRKMKGSSGGRGGRGGSRGGSSRGSSGGRGGRGGSRGGSRGGRGGVGKKSARD